MSSRLLLLTLALFSVVPGLALADLPAVMACAGQADDKLRLACFDAAVAKLKAEVTEAEARNNTLFGFQLPFGGSGSQGAEGNEPELVLGPKPVNEVDAKLKSASKDFSGHIIVVLDNGQSWQIQDSPPLTLFHADAPVRIVRNIFGGYYLGVNGRDNELSVNRLR